MNQPATIALYALAHSRSGDKGNRSNLSVIARAPEYYPVLARLLTTERVARHFAHRFPSAVMRYDLPRLDAFNFVLDDLLEGGVNASLGLDGHGKTLSFYLLGLTLELDAEAEMVIAEIASSLPPASAGSLSFTEDLTA